MLDNSYTKHGKKVDSHRNVVAHKNAIYLLDRTHNKRRCTEESRNRAEGGGKNHMFPGHTVREQGLEKVVITGEIEGDGARGRPMLNFMQRLSQLVSVSNVEIIKSSAHRRKWKSMTDDV